jgi:hypothetical protein
MVYRHQRRETDMHIFEVIGVGATGLNVFATSYDDAVRIYMAHWLARQGGDLPDLEVKQRNVGWAGIDREALTEAMSLEISGIGQFDPERGWRILPPGYDVEEA